MKQVVLLLSVTILVGGCDYSKDKDTVKRLELAEKYGESCVVCG
jgi:hypothetical protein